MTATEGQPTALNGRDFHILWGIAEGHTPDEVASMLGYTARWVRTLSPRTGGRAKQTPASGDGSGGLTQES